MKLIAKEIHLCPLMLGEEVLNIQQAKTIYDYYLKGFISEVHNIEETSEVVVKMDCLTRREAESLLSKLPLVRAGKSTFEIFEIKPYKGFEGLL